MSSARKKQKHEQKRKERQKELRKERNLGLVAQLRADDHRRSRDIECYINDCWPTSGQAAIFVLRAVGSGHVVAAFLVDFGVAGLKDAWGLMNMTPSEFHEKFIDGSRGEMNPVPCDLSLARQLVAGAIRQAHDFGFRLPPDYKRWTAVLGGVDDWSGADCSLFTKEFVGSFDDLRKRYIGGSLVEFMQREDIVFILDARGPSLVGGEHDQHVAMRDTLIHEFLAGVKRWLAENGEQPHSHLSQAVALHLRSMLECGNELADEPLEEIADDADEPHPIPAEAIEQMPRILERELLLLPELDRNPTIEAWSQVIQFVEGMGSIDRMMEYVSAESKD